MYVCMHVRMCVCFGVCRNELFTVSSLLYGPSPIADTALTCTPYDTEGTSLIRSVPDSVVVLIGPCQDRLPVWRRNQVS